MNPIQRFLMPLIVSSVCMSSVARADHDDARADHDDFAYKQTNLVSDGAVPARITDPQLRTVGIAAFPEAVLDRRQRLRGLDAL
jgi:hypothetical protein